MDLSKVLQQLHRELENLDAAIKSLERLQEATRKREKTPATMVEAGPASRRGRKPRTVEESGDPEES